MTAENKPDPRVDPEGWCAYWREQIKQAQQQRTVTIAGTVYERVPYGPDSSMVPFCPDCNVAQGELHVPECDVERCPCCDGQAISCPCSDDPIPYLRLVR